MEHEYKFPQRSPFFTSIAGSIDEPGIPGTNWYGHPIATYELQTVTADEILVVEYISAGVMCGSVPYPVENLNDLGEIGFKTAAGKKSVHSIPFARSEPGAILHVSQTIHLYVPSNSVLFVAVPLIDNQSGGAKIDVSGYTLKSLPPQIPNINIK